MPDPKFGSHPKAVCGRPEYLRLRRAKRFEVGKDGRYLFIEQLVIEIGLKIVGQHVSLEAVFWLR